MTDTTAQDCIFCRIVAGEFGTDHVAESDHAIVIDDIHPAAPVHVLVIPKQHATMLHDVTDPAVLADCMLLAAQVAASKGLTDTGYKIVSNNGAGAGQSVFHLHFHVLGGKKFSEHIG